MKSLDLLEKHYTSGKKSGTGASSPSGKLPLLRKADLLHELNTELKTVDKKTLTGLKKRIVTVLDAVSDEGAGAALSRILAKLYEELFELVDRSRLPQFFDREMQIISSGKVEAAHKMYLADSNGRNRTHLYLAGRMYQRFASGMMMSAPTSELMNAVFKFGRYSNEWYARESALMCIRRIIKGKSSTMSSHWSDLLKSLSRFEGDKSVEVRIQAAKCFKEAAKNLHGSAAAQFYEAIFSASVKGFEDEQKCVREQYVRALAASMAGKLQESAGERAFNAPSKRRASEPPKNLLDVYSALQSVFSRDADLPKECVALCIWHVMRDCPDYVRQTRPLLILQLELTWLSKATAHNFENYKSRMCLGWLLVEYMKLLDLSTQLKLMETIISNLEKIVERHEKGQQQANDSQVILIISALNALILQLGPHIVEHNPSVNHITDYIVPFLSWEQPAVRTHAAECIKSLVYRCRPWVCQLLSLFLNMTTVAHAELAALSPAALFSSDVPVGKDSLSSYYTSLSVQSGCLSSLLYGTELLLSGVPLDIANSALVSAKGIIMGYRMAEDDEERPNPDVHAGGELVAKRHAGWMIIQGLLGLGNVWVSGQLSALVKLWNATFSKESCVTNPLLQDEKTDRLEQLAQDFVVKADALAALHEFVTGYKELINAQVAKFVANSLVNCAQYLFSNFGKEPRKSLFEKFPVKYLQMKAVHRIGIHYAG